MQAHTRRPWHATPSGLKSGRRSCQREDTHIDSSHRRPSTTLRPKRLETMSRGFCLDSLSFITCQGPNTPPTGVPYSPAVLPPRRFPGSLGAPVARVSNDSDNILEPRESLRRCDGGVGLNRSGGMARHIATTLAVVQKSVAFGPRLRARKIAVGEVQPSSSLNSRLSTFAANRSQQQAFPVGAVQVWPGTWRV